MRFRVPANASPIWRHGLDSIPSNLLTRLEVTSQPEQPSTELSLPRPIRAISNPELFAILMHGGWVEFFRRYPHQRQLLQLTPIAFSTEGLDALVYFEYLCGQECRGANAVWLKRDQAQSWKIRKVVSFWKVVPAG
jgi:hypothetical protein